MKKIMPIYGTRPEAIKVAPIVKALQADERFECVVTVTGQHREMLDQVNELFGIVPDHDLNIIQPRQTLNGVFARTLDGLDAVLEQERPDAVVVQDVPLLVETGQADAFDLVIVVEAPLEERLRRMVEDRGMSRADAEARIAAQATDEQRRAVADVVIVNDADLERLASVANQVWDRFLAPGAAEPSAD